MMRVGILGGSFNPLHQGHVYICELAIKKLHLNQVWMIPASQNPLKASAIDKEYSDRVLACKKLTKNNHRIKIYRFDEIYTIELVKRLKSRYKNIQFFWLMGADLIRDFHRWHNFKKIISLVHLVIFSRENFLLKIRTTHSWNFIKLGKYSVFHTKNLDISSTKLRNGT